MVVVTANVNVVMNRENITGTAVNAIDVTQQEMRSMTGTAVNVIDVTQQEMRSMTGTAVNAIDVTQQEMRSMTGTAVNVIDVLKQEIRNMTGILIVCHGLNRQVMGLALSMGLIQLNTTNGNTVENVVK